jgi:salicylate hydroxylase
MRSRTIVVAGAGIGGLTTALALAAAGFRVVVMEQAERLEPTGAGLQLSPNASRILLGLGIAERLRAVVVRPSAIRVMAAKTGRELLSTPLGAAAEARYGAPYWVIHRGDLHAALLAAAAEEPDITIALGRRVDAFAIHANGVTVHATYQNASAETHGIALIGADGLWSSVHAQLHPGLHPSPAPRFASRIAWRATVPAEAAPPQFREPIVHLWLGRDSHLVHYPVNAGRTINIVAIARDQWQQEGWSVTCDAEVVLERFRDPHWSHEPRSLLALPERWLKWALFDRAPLLAWGRGPVTLLGDAAHPMLPFLAQGAAMAIEDAAVLAAAIGPANALERADAFGALAAALRNYEAKRRVRTADVQRGARINAALYHLRGPAGTLRDLVLTRLNGERFLARYDWIYDWKPIG